MTKDQLAILAKQVAQIVHDEKQELVAEIAKLRAENVKQQEELVEVWDRLTSLELVTGTAKATPIFATKRSKDAA